MANDYASLTNAQTVATNRAGSLTEEQRARIGRETRGCGVFVAVLLVAFGSAFLVPALIDSGVFGGTGVAVGSLVCGSPLLIIGVGMVALGLYAPVGISRRQRMLAGELVAGRVAHGDGWVAYTPRGYIARMEWIEAMPGARAAGWRRGRRVNLPPGRYRFYFLPQSGTLLSAESLDAEAVPEAGAFSRPSVPAVDPLAGLPGYSPTPQPYGGYVGAGDTGAAQSLSPQALGALQAALAEALRFTMQDIAENQQGRLSAEQARRLTRPSCFSVAFGVTFFVCAASSIVAFLLSAFPRIGAAPVAVALTLVGLVALGLVSRRTAGIRDGRVMAIEGVVRGVADTAGESTSYYFVLDTMRLQVQYAAYVALISGLRYRVFYTPRAKRVVGVEPLGA